MSKSLFGFLIVILLLCMSKHATLGATLPVVLKADEIRYTDENRQIQAQGEVEIRYKDIKINADQAVIDQDLKTVLVYSNVTVERDNQVYCGDRFLYDLRSERGWLSPMNSEIKDEEINGPVFLSSNEAFYKQEDITLKGATFTSCDLDHPHYHLTAKELEYYPEDRIVFHQVWYWEGKYRILYFPYFMISLKDYENGFESPKIGRNDSVGWYLHWGYNYYMNEKNYGRILFDITEYGGDGIGVQHYTKNSPTSRWYQKYYYLDNSDNLKPLDEYMFGFGYENWENPKLKWDTDLESWSKSSYYGKRYDKTTYSLNLKGISPYPQLSFKYRTDETLQEELDLGGSWYYSDSKWSFNTNGRWLLTDYTGYSSPQNQLYLQLLLNRKWANSNLEFKITDKQVLSGDFYSINYLPAITYVYSKWDWPLLGDIYFKTNFVNLEKITTDEGQIIKKENGTLLGMDIRKTIQLGTKNKLSYSSDSTFRSRLYEVEGLQTEILAFTEALRGTYRFNDKFYTQASFGLTESDGITNNFFPGEDYISPGASVTNGWYWSSSKFNASVTGGYYFSTKYVQPIYISTTWTPGAHTRLSFQTNYEWENGFRSTYLNINHSPKENWTLGMSLAYDVYTDLWSEQQFQSYIVQQITSNWRIELRTRYDVLRDSFSEAKLGVVRDWHCRELMFSYDDVEKKYWIQLNFKAFPQATVGLSSDPSEFMSQWTGY